MFATLRRHVARGVGLQVRAKSGGQHNVLNRGQLPFLYNASGPTAVRYTDQHEWIAAHADGTAFVGVTKYAADALGDATYVELPAADAAVEVGEGLGSIESVKSASEVYAPAGGVVVEANEALQASPQLLNQDPMGAGWLCRLRLHDAAELDSDRLMTLERYEQSLREDA
ncbi:ADR396Wp [Eremothecium gossypii ATCC 10895]|uniref:Glycine cleavage system H protein n=1 Tax=Eremothecium gossypii (strain ATCC 10895 / CBS 109.51 / FGSC 9923 / NRRL Y-1056) TaxID=284811 RepID=Q758Y2_EREGS|nr:ADR396Wp [Eremothecium gossypii ATCC 10895]AAS52315.2 ADR396Wp [Eremothecium gossypii ATCC 10895]AEY96612.1 FADR396Wp [Eremothecium gossypii FDAG1]